MSTASMNSSGRSVPCRWSSPVGFVLLVLSGLQLLGAAIPPPTVPADSTGLYRNPILPLDLPDPDVIRVGDWFYMTVSSFHEVPGLPVLRSRDLMHWSVIGHALSRLPSPDFDLPQHGNGAWAPSIRFRAGRFYVFCGDPDRGIFMVSAERPEGPWTEPHYVKRGKGLIDPCPLWRDDGTAYLVHAWAKSRAGFNSVLTVHRMSPDGRSVLDSGTVVFDGHANHPTIEGPKFYERNGYVYIFAPAGGVKPGWQTVLRGRSPFGPFEDRIVLSQGSTQVNGPHQGGWVVAPDGREWFVHFQDRGLFGRIVHLQPLRWNDNWPVIGHDRDGDGTGEPVSEWSAPSIADTERVLRFSDDFSTSSLGPVWQWNANPDPTWASLTMRPGWMRLPAIGVPEPSKNLWTVPSLLVQRIPDARFSVTVRVDVSQLAPSGRFIFAMYGMDQSALVVRRSGTKSIVSRSICLNAPSGNAPVVNDERTFEGTVVLLRIDADGTGSCSFAAAPDGGTFETIGQSFAIREGRWIGARVALGCLAPAGVVNAGWSDVDRITFTSEIPEVLR
jgi:beta-xylosidase